MIDDGPLADADGANSQRLPLRVGGIDYLNAQPLLYSLLDSGEPPLSVRSHPPRDLARLLREGELDVALLPVVAYPERADYYVVPGIAISSYGTVRSIRLYHRCPLAAVRTGTEKDSRGSCSW